MVACVDAQRETHGVESICRQLPIAPSTYWRYKAQQTDPTRRSARAKRDEALEAEIHRVWHEQEEVYGADKVWRQLRLEGITTARCTVARLMKGLGLRGVVRGQLAVITTRPDSLVVVPISWTGSSPRTGRISSGCRNFTYVPTAEGFVYSAFVIDVFAHRIVCWKVSTAMRTALMLDALEQAIEATPRRRAPRR
jgi:transposase InsO family protein